MKKILFIFMLLGLCLLAGCSIPAASSSPAQEVTPSASAGNAKITPTYPCPMPTPEYLAVEPLPLRTDQNEVYFFVYIGNGEEVTISSEAGMVNVKDNFDHIKVPLVTGITHNFQVTARVRRVVSSDGCEYGGYTLSTTRDRNGLPLQVIQGPPITPPAPGGLIDPDSLAGLQLINTLTSPGMVSGMFFLNDLELLTVGDQIIRWDIRTGEQLQVLDGSSAKRLYLYASALSPDGRFLAAGFASQEASIWDLSSGKKMTLENPGKTTDSLTDMSYSPDGTLLAGSDSQNFYLWDAITGKLVNTFTPELVGQMNRVLHLRWWDNDQVVVVMDHQVDWWNIKEGILQSSVPPPGSFGGFYDFIFSSDHLSQLAVSGDTNLYLWDESIKTWASYPTLKEFTSLSGLNFNPEGNLLVISTYGQATFFDVAGKEFLPQPKLPLPGFDIIRFNPSGRVMAATSKQAGRVWLYGVP